MIIEPVADELVLEEMSFELGESPEWAPETPLTEAVTHDEEAAPTMTWTLDWDEEIRWVHTHIYFRARPELTGSLSSG